MSNSIPSIVRKSSNLDLQINLGNRHRITRQGMEWGSLWITPQTNSFRVLISGEVDRMLYPFLHEQFGEEHGLDQNKKYWKIDDIAKVATIIDRFGRSEFNSRPPPTHLLVSQNDYYDHIIAAGEEAGTLFWTCPGSAKEGDRVLFYVKADGIVASGTVASKPEPSEVWNRRYAATITDIRLLSTSIPLSTILAEMPDFGWARYPRSYVTLTDIHSSQMTGLIDAMDTLYRDFEQEHQEYNEGSTRLVLVNTYERSGNARREAIRLHGSVCAICAFDFGNRYGTSMEGFTHVHHITPLHEIRESYKVDPSSDLISVCPNCHAVIHSRRPALTIEEVRSMLRPPYHPTPSPNT